jgi:hypothetical protein
MPTIEIVSINATELRLDQADFDIAIIEENKLISHRGLFYDFLQKMKGVIIHIGNPDFKDDKEGGFFAGAIVDWGFEPKEVFMPIYDKENPSDKPGANQVHRFKFETTYINDIDRLLKTALDHSPINKAYFLTDIQFGPEEGKTKIIFTVSKFWEQHDTEGLEFNTLYAFSGK